MQVNSLRFQLADLLEEEEEWSEAARVLMGISLDSGQRWVFVDICRYNMQLTPIICSTMPDEDKLRVYVRIVRLLLEDEDSVQAESYYNRAALLVHSTSDKETLLQFKLCQARISDYARKFLEAAMRYHELSWVAEIDEEERRHMLWAIFFFQRTYNNLFVIFKFGSGNLRSTSPSRTQSFPGSGIALPRRAFGRTSNIQHPFENVP